MTAIEKAHALQQEAIAILLAERERIDSYLAQLGYGKDTVLSKKRGRPRLIELPTSSTIID
jgi:hypothetical protein